MSDRSAKIAFALEAATVRTEWFRLLFIIIVFPSSIGVFPKNFGFVTYFPAYSTSSLELFSRK